MSNDLKVVLDTNICIALLNRSSERARVRIEALAASQYAISSIVVFELRYGIARSARVEQNLQVFDAFLENTQVLDFSAADAADAGQLRLHLRSIGSPIGPYDLLIAGQARARGLVLATNNIREFSRVPGLAVEDWLA